MEERVSGTVYPMLHEFGRGFGSIETTMSCDDDDDDVKMCKVYPHLIHYLKATGLNIEMPTTMRGMKTKLSQIQQMLVALENVHPSLVCGYRLEFEMHASAPIDTCYDLVADYHEKEGVQEGWWLR